MAKFAPVVPIQVADEYQQEGMLGDYHLLLAHDVVANPSEYHRIYGNQGYHIIMDNSVIELGHPVDLEFMRTAVGLTQADVFALPDKLLDQQGTINSTMTALNEWHTLITDQTKAMAVPQGATWDEWVECVEAFAAYDEIAWIGIPRNVRNRLNTSRKYAVSTVKALCPNKKIHLLGFSNDLRDDVEAASLADVEGIDSAVPSRMGMRDCLPINIDSYAHSARDAWWDNPGEVNDLGITNVTTFRSWIS